MNKKFKIKKGDSVIVITGRDKGKLGNVLSILKDKDRVIVQGINIIKRHRKATQESPGKIEEIEASVHISNVSHAKQLKNEQWPLFLQFYPGVLV